MMRDGPAEKVDGPETAFAVGPTQADMAGCSLAPSSVFDVALLDLDGVLYVSGEAVPHAAEALERAAAFGMRREYVTNNALRPPEEVAASLTALGIPADPDQVVTSAQAAARLLGAHLATGSRVLVAGGRGLAQAVQEAGLETVRSADDSPEAVVLGYDPTLDYARLAEAALAVRRGALFVAANRDATVPTSRGPMPGLGSIVALVVTATGVEPLVAGKPERALHAESIRRSGALRPLVVGDRLDTDVEGARRAGTPSLLVLTGVTDLSALLAAPPHQRPDLISSDLRGLNVEHPPSEGGQCRGAVARYDDREGFVRVECRTDDVDDMLRAVTTAGWAAADAGKVVAGVVGLDGAADSARGQLDR